MKGMKKLLSILMVLTLVLSLGATAFAATITVENAKDDTTVHDYEIYQIFAGKESETDAQLTDITWGSGIDGDGFLKALQADEDEEFKAAFTGTEKEPVKTAADVAKVLGKNAKWADKFAAIAAEHLTTVKETISSVPGEKTSKDLAGAGYYLIIDKTAEVKNADGSVTPGAYNKTMLQVTGSVDITPKYDIPSSEKKVLDGNDTNKPITEVKPGKTNEEVGWQDSADHDIGDIVNFKLTGTMPSDLLDTDAAGLPHYEKYEVIFHDQEGTGLTFMGKDTVKVYLQTSEDVEPTLISADNYTVTAPAADGHTFDVSFTNVKEIEGIANGAKIIVVYQSKLNDSAVIGKPGNPNEMQMEYTNKSDNSGKGKTPWDKVIVFTYDLDTNKVDDDNKPLTGAKFSLYKYITDQYVAREGDVLGYVSSKTGEFKTGETPAGPEWHKAVRVTLTEKDLTVDDESAESAKFYAKGVDDGTYLIVEDEAPDGYNKIDPFEFDITATHTDGANPDLSSVEGDGIYNFTLTKTAQDDDAAAMGQRDVVNNEGPVLPETGGIGTTIFYVAGAILAAGAVILLVTKKRVNGMEK